MSGFKALAKHNGSGAHGVHFFHHESHIKCVHEVQLFIFGWFLDVVFEVSVSQNYMFRHTGFTESYESPKKQHEKKTKKSKNS